MTTTVALVGRRLPYNENLGLAYLRAALEGAGMSATTHYVNDAAGLARAVGAILSAPPQLVGLSLADGGSALLPLAIGEALARAGYRGHVTAGGQFATLAREWLLGRYPWLGSVVRFAGEVPLVALARRVAAGELVDGVPGVTTRAGDGPPAPVLDPTPMMVRPTRDDLPTILAYRAAHIIASRGCEGRCEYCSPAALQTLELREGPRAGLSLSVLRKAGVGGVRRRDIDSICDEMADLYHERGVRYFYFLDEHVLPHAEGEALSFLEAWGEGLRRRRVRPVGIGAMLQAAWLTPALASAFARIGLMRAFIGLELATDEERRWFGRSGRVAGDMRILEAFAEAGVTTVSNLMLIHPYSTPATIAAGVDFLERIPNGVFEATQMLVYHGTRLHERMAAEGRLLGNPLQYAYTFADPVTSRFAEVFTRLRGEIFRNYSVGYRTHDCFLSLVLAQRLDAARVPAYLPGQLESLRVRINRLYVRAYRCGLDLALQGGGYAAAGSLVSDLSAPASDLERELDRLEERVLALAPPRTRMFAPGQAAAAAVSVFTYAVATTACGGRVNVTDTTGAWTPDATSPAATGQDAGPAPVVITPPVVHAAPKDAGVDTSVVITPPVLEAGPQDAGVDTSVVITPPAVEAGPKDAGVDTSVVITPPVVDAGLPDAAGPVVTVAQVEEALDAGAACFSGNIEVTATAPPFVEVALGAVYGGSELIVCDTTGSTLATEEMQTQAAEALAAVSISASSTPVYAQVSGGSDAELSALSTAVNTACASLLTANPTFDITLDATGAVVSVTTTPPTTPAAPICACIETALAGLTFPCLAGFDLCPQPPMPYFVYE